MKDNISVNPKLAVPFVVIGMVSITIVFRMAMEPPYRRYVNEMKKVAWSEAEGWNIDSAMQYILGNPEQYDMVISEDGHEELLCHILLWEVGKDFLMTDQRMARFEQLLQENYRELRLFQDEDGSWHFYPQNSAKRKENRFRL